MLEYLDSLCSALIARDRAALRLLLADPRGAELPSSVRGEIDSCLSYEVRSAPLRTLHFYYENLQRQHYFAGRVSVSRQAQLREVVGDVQIELPLTAA